MSFLLGRHFKGGWSHPKDEALSSRFNGELESGQNHSCVVFIGKVETRTKEDSGEPGESLVKERIFVRIRVYTP